MKPYPETPDGLAVDHDGPVLRLRLDRPERRNAITDPIVYALIDLVDAASSDESVRVIHLTGRGDHFCSGFDLGERTPGPERPRVGSVHRRMHAHVNRLIPAMLSTQTPIVCTARGWVIGLGLDLALASDFTIVADDARLWAPFTTFGFTPDSGATWLAPRLAGVARARRMLLLGEKVSGADAASWGLVHDAVPATDLDAAGEELVGRLASGPTVALGLTKLVMHRGLTVDIDRHLADEAWAMEMSSRSEDFKEHGDAAREKRDPNFEGR
ncbi:MAG: enoyl-CoA hydratase/isomerase family protein [Acidimicrobiia bacterium]|nr:enoyl-CoA hydratase/isomerase family protein [Acidimicrobiia bacterium]